MISQTTALNPVSCSGVGLHSGLPCNLTVRAAACDNGIVFVRKDLPKKVRIRAQIDNVVESTLATTLGREGVRVSTVEHLLAAFAGLGIDNADVELDAPEVPIMDGSSDPFHTMLKRAGVSVQDRVKKFLIIKRPVTVTEGDRQAILLPSNDFKISYTIDFGHPPHLQPILSDSSFQRQLRAGDLPGPDFRVPQRIRNAEGRRVCPRRVPRQCRGDRRESREQ